MGYAINIATLRARRIALMPRWAHLKTNPAGLEAVASKIGVSKPTLWRWEEFKGKGPPREVFLEAWQKVLMDLEERK